MELLVFSWLDYTLFTLMFGFSGAVGIFYGCFKKQETTKDYLLGGKHMKVFPVAMSLVASTLSGVSLLGIPTEVYVYGTQYWMMALSIFTLGFAIYFIYLPVFYELHLTSAFEYLELRFSKKIRAVASLVFILNNLVYLPVVIYAPSLAFNQVTGVNLHITATAMSLLCIFYTTIGGLKAVVWADTLQFCVTLCTLFFVLILGVISVGGFQTVWEKAQMGDRIEFFNMNPDPTVRLTFWSVFIGNFFLWASLVATNPPTIQRFSAVSTLSASKKVLGIYIVFTIITKLVSCLSGLIVYAKYFNCDPFSAGFIKKPDQILPYYVLDIASHVPGLSGLFIAGLFSTALSTLSTYLNSLSGIIYIDFISSFMPKGTSEKRASNIMKVITVGVGLTSLALVFVVEKLGSIIELASGLSGITGGPLVGLFTMGLIFPFANRKGALSGVLASFIFMSFLIVKTQIYVWNHQIRFQPKPLYTHACNITLSANATRVASSNDDLEEPFWLFRISFYYYMCIGTFVVMMVGLPVSWFTRKASDIPISPAVLSPCVRRFLPKSTVSAEYATVSKALHVLDTAEMTEEDHRSH